MKSFSRRRLKRGREQSVPHPGSRSKGPHGFRSIAVNISVLISALLVAVRALAGPPSPGNRLAYLDSADPFHVGLHFPKLTTPQWAGDAGVDAVVTLGIDDMSQSAKYEAFLRPILNRLRQIDGRAPVSIFCNSLTPTDPQLPTWLKEGVSLEVHTLSHPCPILAKHDFSAAQNTFHGGVELLSLVPGSTPVAFRTPCCDSINSASPRLFAELFARTNSAGQFLRLDSSVVLLLTTNDPTSPTNLVLDPDGRGRFTKYVPFPSFVGTVQDYPYPWVIGRAAWEFAFIAPTDWQAQNILGITNATMLADWQAALDIVARKQGTLNLTFHPHGWSAPSQFVALIDYAVRQYGARVKFLTFREAEERLTRHLGGGQALRAADGSDNGVRLLDLNHDGFMDVTIGNAEVRRTRLWNAADQRWIDSDFPTALVERRNGGAEDAGVRFGVLHADGRASLLVRNERVAGAWSFHDGQWRTADHFLRGLEIDGRPILTSQAGRDRGVRLRDMDGDGVCELLVANETEHAGFRWSPTDERWVPLLAGLPAEASFVNGSGEDQGLRFADINEDGFDDVLYSNEDVFGMWLHQRGSDTKATAGWTRRVSWQRRAEPGATATPRFEIPPIVRAGPRRNNGAWIHSRHLWIQNENTAHLPDLVDRRSFATLLRGVDPLLLEHRVSEAREGSEQALVEGLELVLKLDSEEELSTQLSSLAALLDAAEIQGKTSRVSWTALEPILTKARRLAFQSDGDDSVRVPAVRLAGRVEVGASDTAFELVEMVDPKHSPELQRAAVSALRRQKDQVIALALLDSWGRFSPTVRADVLDALVSNPAWAPELLEAVESGRLAPREFDATARQTLRQHPDPRVKSGVERLLNSRAPEPTPIAPAFASVAGLEGDKERGKARFVANCARCHRFDDAGSTVGPDLGASTNRSAESLLVAVLDPNHAVDPRHYAYTAMTWSGRQFTGLVVRETPQSLTLRGPDGVEEEFARGELSVLRTLSRSLMPDDFARRFDAQALADLFAFLRSADPEPNASP